LLALVLLIVYVGNENSQFLATRNRDSIPVRRRIEPAV